MGSVRFFIKSFIEIIQLLLSRAYFEPPEIPASSPGRIISMNVLSLDPAKTDYPRNPRAAPSLFSLPGLYFRGKGKELTIFPN